MKKLLSTLLPVVLISNISFFNLSQKNNTENQIVWNLNIKESKKFATNVHAETGIISGKFFVFNFLNYAPNIKDFITTYPHFKFNPGDYVNGSVYGDNPTDYLNKTYNTANLQSHIQVIMIDELKAKYNNSWVNTELYLSTQLGVKNNQLCFGISYDLYSSKDSSVNPEYNINISQIIFFAS